MARKTKVYTHYFSNEQVLAEIKKSIESFNYYVDEQYIEPDFIGDTLPEKLFPGKTYRVNTYDHIPDHWIHSGKARKVEGVGIQQKLSFAPFQHFALVDGEVKCVAKSHWEGGIDNGWFNARKGKITHNLAKAIMSVANGLSNAPNFRGYTHITDWRSEAVMVCIQYILKFDFEKSSNPFGYITKICYMKYVEQINKMNNELHKKNRYIDTCLARINPSTGGKKRTPTQQDQIKGGTFGNVKKQ